MPVAVFSQLSSPARARAPAVSAARRVVVAEHLDEPAGDAGGGLVGEQAADAVAHGVGVARDAGGDRRGPARRGLGEGHAPPSRAEAEATTQARR